MPVEDQKTCCSRFYEQQQLRLLLGDWWHPGGQELTLELGNELKLEPEDQVLDIATGLGSTGVLLAKNFGCSVTGLDLSPVVLATAKDRALALSNQVSFCRSDAEKLPFRNAAFDAVFSECSLCMFPSKASAAKEMYQVLSHDGRCGISDMTLQRELPGELRKTLWEFLCIAEARPESEYRELFARTGFVNIRTRDKSEALLSLLENLRKALFTVELLTGLKKLSFSVENLNKAKAVLKEVTYAAKNGTIGYITLTAFKPGC